MRTHANAVGSYNTASNTEASAFGHGNIASGLYSSAFGFKSTASNGKSSAFGCEHRILRYGVAVGSINTASGPLRQRCWRSQQCNGRGIQRVWRQNIASGY